MNKKSNLEKLLEGLFLFEKKSNLTALLEELYTDIDKEEKLKTSTNSVNSEQQIEIGQNTEEKEPETPEEFVASFKDAVIDPVDQSEEIMSDEQMEDYLEGRFEQATTVKDTAPANEAVYGMNEINEEIYEQEKSAGARAVV